MSLKNTKLFLFTITTTSLITIGITDSSLIQNTEAFVTKKQITIQTDRIIQPKIHGLDSQIFIKYTFPVQIENGKNTKESRSDTIGCDRASVNGFYSSTYNTRIISWQFPSKINHTCKILDRNFNTNTSYALDEINYTITGDGNSSISGKSNHSTDIKRFYDATSNRGTMLVTITATYSHVLN